MDKEFSERYLNARRAVICRDFQRLNPRQQEAVLATEGPLLVLAGAGSGKTTVLIDRIYNLIRYGRASDCGEIPEDATEEDLRWLEAVAAGTMPPEKELLDELCAFDPVEPWRIIAITFTNKAAGELKSRLREKLGEAAEDIWAMTFHSACVRILRREIEILGYSRSFTIYDASDSLSIVKRLLKEMNVDDKSFPPRSVLAEISAAKDRGMDPGQYLEAAEKGADLRKKKMGEIWRRYELQLRDANALDFDDLIVLTVRLLRDFPQVRDYYQRKFRYVLIDEYQDTDRMQYRLAALLSGGTSNLCVVGDDDQSIYKFRGATIENILQFEQQFPGARVIRLEQNYRSTGNILSAANSVIKENKGRKGKTLWTKNGSGEKIELHTSQNDEEEARFVTGTIVAGAGEGGSFSDYAVLYRMNSQSNRLEFAFKRAGIPYRVYGGMRFYDRAEVKDMLAYLCVVANPGDDLRLTRIINNPPRGIGAKTIENAEREAQERGESLWQVLKAAETIPDLKRAAPRLKEFTALIEELQEAAGVLPLEELYDRVVDRSGYMAMLLAADTQENRTRAENVQELRSSILSYAAGAPEPSLAGFLEETALYSELDEMEESDSAVTMMTIHSAKGLEFNTVFLVGMEDGVFPGMRAIGEDEEMEEERRLCYVAITRAKERLILSCAQQRMLYGRTSSNLPSRFIDEIPEDCLNRTGVQRRSYSGYGFEDEEESYDTEDYGYGSRRSYGGYSSYGGGYGSRNDGGGYGGYGSRDRYRGYGEERRSSSGGGWSAAGKRSADENRQSRTPGSTARELLKKAAELRAAAPAPREPAPAVQYALGDRVKHKAFGEGTIVKMTPAGTDFLIEVEFNGKSRKLMLKAAAPYMEKL